MDRREFLGTIAGGLLALPLSAEAQPATKTSRIGYLSPTFASEPDNRRRLGALREGLRDLGYVEGQNLTIESRWAEGQYGRLPDLAAELVRLKVDVIVTYAPPAIQAAKQATGTIPIVMAGIVDPVATGFVASLARPGGNITGLSLMAPELVGKQLEILKQAIRKVTRVAVLGNPANAGTSPQLRHAQEAARALKVRLQLLEARGPDDLDGAFAKMTKEGAGAVVVLVDAMLIDQRTRVADLAAKHRLPSIYGLIEFVEAGGLLFYGAHDASRFRRAAMFVDKILKGAKPADLPIEQPTKFELVINRKTAKALGFTIPQSLLLRADQVIE
jgi:putative tryptophan/tyrosine transport system substrate-binding protein